MEKVKEMLTKANVPFQEVSAPKGVTVQYSDKWFNEKFVWIRLIENGYSVCTYAEGSHKTSNHQRIKSIEAVKNYVFRFFYGN